MHIVRLPVGPLQTNCYLCAENGNVWIIDPGFSPQIIADYITQHKWKPVAVLLTHAHWDHVMGLPGLMALFPSLSLYLHWRDVMLLGTEGRNLLSLVSASVGLLADYAKEELWNAMPEPTGTFEDGDVVDGISLSVISTPGHTPGSVSFYQKTEHVLFSGDTLFRGSIGRTDLPFSDSDALIASIREKLLVLPPDTKVYPGHGQHTTIAREQENPWLLLHV